MDAINCHRLSLDVRFLRKINACVLIKLSPELAKPSLNDLICFGVNEISTCTSGPTAEFPISSGVQHKSTTDSL